jgi:hypothetical protein
MLSAVLLSEIRDEWRLREIPAASAVRDDLLAYDPRWISIVGLLAGRPFWEIDLSDARIECEEILLALSPENCAYYISAYMIYAVEEYLQRGDIGLYPPTISLIGFFALRKKLVGVVGQLTARSVEILGMMAECFYYLRAANGFGKAQDCEIERNLIWVADLRKMGAGG